MSGFTPEEQRVIGEVRTMLSSPQTSQIREAHANGQHVTVHYGNRYVQYDPEIPARLMSAMTDFEGNGFTMGPGAFASEEEVKKTFLHETYRLSTTQSRGTGVSGGMATAETQATESFANRAYSQVASIPARRLSAGQGEPSPLPQAGGPNAKGAAIGALGQAAHVIIRNGLTQVSLEKAGQQAMNAYLAKKQQIETLQFENPEDMVELRFYFRFQPGVNPDFNDNYYFDGFTFSCGGAGSHGVLVATVPREQGQIFIGYLPALRPRTKALAAPATPSDPFYQLYMTARRGIDPPAMAPYAQCFNVLNSCSMPDMLKIVSLLAQDKFLTLMKNTLPSVSGVYSERIKLALYAVEGFGSGIQAFEYYKSNFSKDFFALPKDQQDSIEAFMTKKVSNAKQDIVGRWSTRVHKWVWTYDFNDTGGVRWTDPFNGMTGTGSWKVNGSQIGVSWHGSKTRDVWDLPINPAEQTGKVYMSEGTYNLKAAKVKK